MKRRQNQVLGREFANKKEVRKPLVPKVQNCSGTRSYRGITQAGCTVSPALG